MFTARPECRTSSLFFLIVQFKSKFALVHYEVYLLYYIRASSTGVAVLSSALLSALLSALFSVGLISTEGMSWLYLHHLHVGGGDIGYSNGDDI